MSIIADYEIEDDLCHLQMNQSLDCEVVCFCTNPYNLLTRCTHVQILWCFRFWHLVVLQEVTCILENLTHWSGGYVFAQNVGTRLSGYMSEPGYHIMNVHCFESLISYTFTHTYAVFHFYCCSCVCDVRIVKHGFYNQRYIKI